MRNTSLSQNINTTEIEVSDKWKEICDTLESTGANVFVTGRAGTGKSTLLQYFRENTQKQVAILAFTGVAAVNVHGQTIHSFFGFKPGITEKRIRKIQDNSFYKKIDTIVIDEVSMVRADLLDCVDKFLRLNGPRPKMPFGGVQMVFIGDLYQLPPVVTGEEEGLFRSPKHYLSPFFFDSKAYQKTPFHNFVLKKVYRQTDESFLQILDSIRLGNTSSTYIQKINKRCEDVTEEKYESHIHLTTTNEAAKKINFEKLNRIKADEYVFTGIVRGKFEEKNLPTDEKLHAKAGAQIMLLNNDQDRRWVNGDIATIHKIESQEHGSVKIFVALENGSIEQLLPYTWEKIRYFYNAEEDSIDSEVIGEFVQYPFRLAWAVTIHKGQGKTFDNLIVNFGRGTFAHGQAYVALSRCRSLSGLVLKEPLEERHVFVEKRVVEFMKQIDPNPS